MRGWTGSQFRRSLGSGTRHQASGRDRCGTERSLPQEATAIIDRPIDFDPAKVLPISAPPRAGRDADERISLEALAEGPFHPGDGGARGLAALTAYARLFGLREITGETDVETVVSCGYQDLQGGAVRIENAWFADRSTLRLMLAVGGDAGSGSPSLVIRAYQAGPASPNDLSPVGEGVQLPPVGPVFHDLLLLDPLMPLLLELSDVEGTTLAIVLLPFPSLLPGGLHWAELKAQQTEANSIDDFWSYSETLLEEAVGGPHWPSRSIGSLAVDRGSTRIGHRSVRRGAGVVSGGFRTEPRCTLGRCGTGGQYVAIVVAWSECRPGSSVFPPIACRRSAPLSRAASQLGRTVSSWLLTLSQKPTAIVHAGRCCCR